jgi:hypothetical protein
VLIGHVGIALPALALVVGVDSVLEVEDGAAITKRGIATNGTAASNPPFSP